jgi:hypothetical protein
MSREAHVRICEGRGVKFPPATRLVNTNAGSEARRVGGLVDCGAVREMEVVRPSRAVLRKKALNHHEGRRLNTVVLSVVGKGAA